MSNRIKSIKNLSCFKLKLLLLIGISLTLLLPFSSDAAEMEDYCIIPPFIVGGVGPNLLLMIDNSASMNDLQYVDDSVDSAYCFDDTYNNSKICSETATNCTVDADCPGDPDDDTCINQYAGYFDQEIVYFWNGGSFEEKIGPLQVACNHSTSYLCVNISGGAVTDFEASGKFLNWLSTSKIDVLKGILTGGKYVDKVCSVSTTVSCTVDADCPGGETCSVDVTNYLEAESRGCVGKRFAKLAPSLDFASGGEITFGVRGTVDNPNDPLSISQGGNTIIDIFEGRFDPSDCQLAIEELQKASPNLGLLKGYIEGCLALAGPVQFARNSHGAFNQAIQVCWTKAKTGAWPPGNYSQSIENQCGNVYGFKDPGDIQPTEPAYVCTDRRKTCVGSDPIVVCNASSDCTGIGPEVCDSSGKPGFLGQCWIDNGNAWTADHSCEEAQLQAFCGELEVQEVIDPTESPSETGDFLNIPAFLIDSGLVSQLGEPIGGLNVKIDEATAPTGLIHDYDSIIRFGIMRFNYCGSASESTSDPNIELVCKDPDDPTALDKDASKIISYIGDTDTVDKINGIKATTWTPFAEAMYNAIAYYVKDATDNPLLDPADFTADASAIQEPINAPPLDPDPDFEAGKNPIQFRCQSNNVLLITDGASTADIEATMTTKVTDVSNLFNDGTIADDSAACGNYSGSSYLDDLSYFAKNKNIFDPNDNDQSDDKVAQSIKTFVVYTGPETSSEVGECNAKTLMDNTATNGGTSLFNPQDPQSLASELEKAFTQIVAGAASGTAASLLASGEGKGANILQAMFYPKRSFQATEIMWTGTLSNLWYYIDPFFTTSSIREDTDRNSILHLINDYMAQFYFDTSELKTKAKLFKDVNGDGSTYTLMDDIEFEKLKDIWEAGLLLWNRDLSVNPRIIKTTIGSGMMDFSTGPGIPTTLKPYLQAADDAEAEAIIRYIQGEDTIAGGGFNPPIAGFTSEYRPRTVAVDLNGDGDTDDTVEGISESAKVWKLGDIVNSTPRVVSWVPLNQYDTVYKDKTYETFIYSSDYGNRGLAFTGANDGMLHAFKFGTLQLKEDPTWNAQPNEQARMLNPDTSAPCSSSDTTRCGEEVWSFIPENALPYLKYFADPDYIHIYTVDATPYVVDASIGDVATLERAEDGTSWRTVLIGSLRLGGASRGSNTVCTECVNAPGADFNGDGDTIDPGEDKKGTSSYFAIDITDPDPANWTLLWEFSNEDIPSGELSTGGLGYSTAGTSVVRINAAVCKNAAGDDIDPDDLCNGEWFVVIPSGPTGPIDTAVHQFMGRSDQNLKFFVLDLRDGTLKKTINTNISNAFGGSAFVSTVDPDEDYQDDAVYLGYTYSKTGTGDTWTTGGVLRIFTKEDPDPNNWVWSKVMDDIGAVVTAVDRLEDTNARVLWLFFGTGRYYYKLPNVIDDASTQRKLFGIKEPCYVDGAFVTTCSDTVVESTLLDVTNDAAAAEDAEGWFINLDAENDPDLGFGAERIITNPVASIVGTAFFTTFKPATDICGFGGKTHLWAVQYSTGGKPVGLVGKALIQVSTGSIEDTDFSTDLTEKGGRRTVAMDGAPPGDQSPTIFTSPPAIKKDVHFIER